MDTKKAYVCFLKAGRHPDTDKVFFTSHSRQAARSRTIFHRNDYTTIWRIPGDYFRQNFHYDRTTGIYRTELLYADIAAYRQEIHHTES